jgi:hypothetical protein
VTGSSKPPRRRWAIHAIGAGSLALLAFLGAAAAEFLSDDFKQKFAPYNKWILAVIVLAAAVEFVRAIVAARAKDAPPLVDAKDPAPAQTGFSVGDHNQGAFSFQGGAATATNTTGDVVGRDKIINHTPPPEPSWKHQLPPPPHDFTGREQELTELLAATECGSVISSLQGLGGVGKTALALKLAERLKDRYPDAQFYLDLRGVSQRPSRPPKRWRTSSAPTTRRPDCPKAKPSCAPSSFPRCTANARCS